MSHKTVRHLAFIATAEHAASVNSRWREAEGSRTVMCLDEALLPVHKARALFSGDVEIEALSALQLDAGAIVEEALKLAEDLFPERPDDPVARVERWALESIRRWLVYAVHSVRIVEEAFLRSQPTELWLPHYKELPLMISHDLYDENPLFFDLLPALCRRKGVIVNRAHEQRSYDFLKRRLMPMKFVVGQWLGSFRQRQTGSNSPSQRPILLSNLDNDLHRQFDLTKMDSIAEQTFAWLRNGEQVVPLEEFLAKVEIPDTTRHGWLDGRKIDLDGKAMPAGTRIRALANLKFLINLVQSEMSQYVRRKRIVDRNEISWWNLLFGSELPYIHRECRLAGAFYCINEYEKTRAVLQKWRPELLVISNFWTDLPKLDAANDLGITTLMTSAGINFIKNDFAQRIAPIVCVYGEAEDRKTVQAAPNVTVIQAGDVLIPPKTDHVRMFERQRQPRRILLGMSGRMFGWWFGSLIFDYKVFEETLRAFAEKIRQAPQPVSVVIKSHPVSDLHALYDQLVQEEGDVFVEHRKPPLSELELSKFDAAVLFSAATTFLAELIRARVPVIYFDGALTSFGKSYFDYQGLTVASNVEDVYASLTPLIHRDCEARASVLHQADSFLARYINPEARPFTSVVEEIFRRGRVTRPPVTGNVSVGLSESPANSVRGASSSKP